MVCTRAITLPDGGLPRLGVQVQTEREFYASKYQLLAGVIRVAGVIITLIMAVGAIFGAMNTMYAAVGQRTREIAVLLTLAFTSAWGGSRSAVACAPASRSWP